MWIRVAKEFKVETINLPLAEYRQHSGGSIHIKNNRAKMERDILNFTREQIESTPLNELIPNLRSEPHAYALRAAIYLQKGGEYGRRTPLAKAGVRKVGCSSCRTIRCCDSGRGCWLSMRTDLFPSLKISHHRIESRRQPSSNLVSNTNGFRWEAFPHYPGSDRSPSAIR